MALPTVRWNPWNFFWPHKGQPVRLLRGGAFVLKGILLGAIVLGLSGCWLIPERALKAVFQITTDQHPNSALFISDQAPAVLTLQVNPDRLDPPALLSGLASKVPLSQGLADLKNGLVENLGLKYDLDIQPWLGSELSLALTDCDLDRNPENGLQPGYLLSLAVQDGTAARQFLQRFWQTRAVSGQPIAQETFKGATLIYDRLSDSPQPTPVASALVGDYFLLFANDPQVLRSALTTAQVPELSLAFNPAYQRALNDLSEPRLGLGVLNLSSLWVNLQQQPFTRKVVDRMAVPPPAELLVSLIPTRSGLKVESALASRLPADTVPPTFATLPDATLPILKLLPPNTLLMATGGELQQLWAEVEGLAAKVGWVKALFEPFQQRFSTPRDAEGTPLLDLVLSGFQGNYAAAIIPNVETPTARDWIVAVDRTAFGAPETLMALDQLAEDRHYEVTQIDFREQTVTTWSKLRASEGSTSPLVEARLGGVHTAIDRYEVFAPNLATLASSIDAWTGRSLVNTASFQNVIAPLAAGGYNYLYLNWPESRSGLEARFPSLKLLEFAGYALFHTLDSVVLRSNPALQDPQGYRIERATIALNLVGGDL
ncbi:MAG: hypothetical protein RLZZ435_1778 [Cyanobacteriota bacterium]